MLRVLRDPRMLMGATVMVVVFLIMVLVSLILPGPQPGASLTILTGPTQKVEVRIDGELIGVETPVEGHAIGLGTHKIELRADGYQLYTQVIQIAEEKPHTMDVPLVPEAPSAAPGSADGATNQPESPR